MALFDKFQARVGRDQGAARLFVASDGYFNVGDVSGGTDGTDITGAALKLALLSPMTRASVTLSVGAAALTVNSTILAKYGYTAYLHAGGASTVSIKLPSAELGAVLFMDFRAWQSDMSILSGNASMVLGQTLSSLSCIMMVNGSVNSAWLKLTCFTAGQWAVTEQSNRTGVTCQLAS